RHPQDRATVFEWLHRAAQRTYRRDLRPREGRDAGAADLTRAPGPSGPGLADGFGVGERIYLGCPIARPSPSGAGSFACRAAILPRRAAISGPGIDAARVS